MTSTSNYHHGITLSDGNNNHHYAVLRVIHSDGDCPCDQDCRPSQRCDIRTEADDLDSFLCSCSSCENRRSVTALVDQFENHKLQMISGLQSLHADSKSLDANASELDARVTAYASSVTSSSRNLSSLKRKVQLKLDKMRSAEKEKDVQKMELGPSKNVIAEKTENEHLTRYESSLKLLGKFADVVDFRLAKRFEQHKHQIEESFQEKFELRTQLKEACSVNSFMVEKMLNLDKLVEELQLHGSGSDEKFKPGESHILSRPPPQNGFSPDCLNGSDVSSFEWFIHELGTIVGAILDVKDGICKDSCSVDNYHLNHLLACVKQVLADNGYMCKKLDALKEGLCTVNKENAALNETVATLNDYIEALCRQNDELLLQFHNKKSKSSFATQEQMRAANKDTFS